MRNTFLVFNDPTNPGAGLRVAKPQEWDQILKKNKTLPRERRRFFITDAFEDCGEIDCMYIETSYKEYKNKVDELYGEEAGENVRAGIAKDKYEELDISPPAGENSQLFYDFFSGRYFESTPEKVQWAEYELNRSVSVNGGASVNEFYDFLGLEELPEYDELGWSADQVYEMYWHSWVEFEHETTELDDNTEGYSGLECTIIHMPMEPFPEFREY